MNRLLGLIGHLLGYGTKRDGKVREQPEVVIPEVPVVVPETGAPLPLPAPPASKNVIERAEATLDDLNWRYAAKLRAIQAERDVHAGRRSQ